MRVAITDDHGAPLASHGLNLEPGDNVVRVGVFAWVRRANGTVDEQSLPDFNLGPITDDEQRKLLGLAL